jgi:hypothetical protein
MKHMKERAMAQFPDLTEVQRMSLQDVANRLHQLNHAVRGAVDSGLSIELQRMARHHGSGNWGDMMMPVVVKRS